MVVGMCVVAVIISFSSLHPSAFDQTKREAHRLLDHYYIPGTCTTGIVRPLVDLTVSATDIVCPLVDLTVTWKILQVLQNDE